MNNSLIRNLLLAAALTGGVACGGTNPLVENLEQVTAASEEGDFEALVAAGSEAWERRGDVAAVREAIEAWERATRVPTPDGVERNAALYPVYVKLSQAWYWLAHGHLRWETDARDAMLEAYDTGRERAQVALALNNPEWNRQLQRGAGIPDAARALTEADVPAMYWYATNLGRWGLLRGITTVLANVPDIKAMMDRVEELDFDYFYGASDRYFGVYYTKLPFGNPDLEQSYARLQRCIERYPSYLETRVLLAEDWAFKTQDRATSEEQLRIVLDTDLSQFPDLLPENENARRRAQYLMDNLDEFFR